MNTIVYKSKSISLYFQSVIVKCRLFIELIFRLFLLFSITVSILFYKEKIGNLKYFIAVVRIIFIVIVLNLLISTNSI